MMEAESSGESLPPGKYAARRLAPLVYERLHERATLLMHGERRDHTLGATGVLNEALLRLGDFDEPKWDSKGHLIGAAYKAMQCVLIDHARKRKAAKRKHVKEPLDPEMPVAAPSAPETAVEDYERLFQAIDKLAAEEPDIVPVVRLKLIGLTNDEIAGEVGVSLRTINNRWKYAKAWLARELPDGGETTGITML
jgi:RNA polymerase sigma factor (TIGR02999 family)